MTIMKTRNTVVGCVSLCLLAAFCAGPVLAGSGLGETYSVYWYNGLYGFKKGSGLGWGWKTSSWIPDYKLVDTGVPRADFFVGKDYQYTHAVTGSPPPTATPPFTIKEWDFGVVAVLEKEIGVNSWQWDSDLQSHGVAACCVVYQYKPNPKQFLTDRESTAASDTTPSHFQVKVLYNFNPSGFPPSSCTGCSDGGSGGSVSAVNQCVDITFNLGSAGSNLQTRSMGSLSLRSETLSPDLAARSNLLYTPMLSTNAAPITVNTDGNGWLTSIVSSQYVAFVTNVVDGFQVAIYTNPAAETPVSVTTITQPDGGTNLVVQFESDELGSWEKEYMNEVVESGHHGIVLVEKDTSGNILRRWATAEWTNGLGNATEVEIMRDGSAGGGAVVLRHAKSYTQYTNALGKAVWRRTSEEIGSSPVIRTNTWEYDEFGREVFSLAWNGAWTRTVYEGSNYDAQASQVITPWLNAPPDAWTNSSQCRIQYRTTSDFTNNLVRVTTEVDTQVTAGYTNRSSTQITVRPYGRGSIVSQTNIIVVGETALTNSTAYGPQGYPFLTVNADGTIQSNQNYIVYGWTNGCYQGRSVQVVETYTGSPDVSNGFKSISVEDILTGQQVERRAWLVADGATLLTEDYRVVAVDSQWRPSVESSLRGTNESVYACCGVVQTVDEDGIVTENVYDALKRLILTTRAGVTTSNLYDAAGRVVATYTVAAGGTPILTSSNLYNTAGESVASYDALLNVTTYTNWVDSANGWVYQKTTYPNGAWALQQSYRDGQQYQTSGTATHGTRNSYSIQSDGTSVSRVTRLDDAGSPTDEWTESYADMAGRQFKTMRNGGVTLSQSYYNSKGQQWKETDADGVTTLYSYDDAGQQEVVATDMDRNDQIDYTGTDRMSASKTAVATNNGFAVRRMLSYIWRTDGQDVMQLVSMADSTPDGLRYWHIANGLTNTSQTTIDRFHAARMIVSAFPDGSQTITVYTNGLLMSVTRKDSTGSQLATTIFRYDGLNRQTVVVDGRGVTNVTAHNSAGQVVAVTNAVGTPEQQVTTYQYDNMGRQVAVVQPDGATNYVAYLLTGETATNWGVRTYPVAYTYDYAGRIKTMTTWTNFISSAGAAVTTWNYDSTNGLLSSKEYNDGQGPSYTYTDAGRLLSRAWVRGVTTTCGYNNAEDQASISYSDGTPSVTNTYARDGRRVSVASSADSIAYLYNDARQITNETHTAGLLAGRGLVSSYDSFLRRASLSVLDAGAIVPSESSFYGYDNASRLLVVSNAAGHSATYSYVTGADMVGGIAFASGGTTRMVTSKTYDRLNRLTSITNQPSAAGAVSFDYQYNQANQRTQSSLSDGTYWDYSYDSLGQVTNGVRRWASDNSIVSGQNYGYAFDDIGNRRFTTLGGTTSVSSVYSANLLNQYTERTVPGVIEILGSAASNATVTVNLLPTDRHAYPSGIGDAYFHASIPVSNESAAVYQNVTVTAVLKNAGTNQQDIVSETSGTNFVPKTPEVFGYDADGNLTSDGRWAYSWDAENRLIAMQTDTNKAGTAVPVVRLEFAYDAQSRRIQKKVLAGWVAGTFSATNTSVFLYDGWNLVSEVGTAVPGGPIHTNLYVWGLDLSGSLQGAGGIGGLLFSAFGGTGSVSSVFSAFDGNGNLAALVDASDGTIAASYEYSPFGETIRATGPLAEANPFRFSTKYTDDETGLLYYGYRYYSPGLGRWLSRDPAEDSSSLSGDATGGAAMTRYAIVAGAPLLLFMRQAAALYDAFRNTPVTWVDAFGLMASSVPPYTPSPPSGGYIPPLATGLAGIEAGINKLNKVCDNPKCCLSCTKEACKVEARQIIDALKRQWQIHWGQTGASGPPVRGGYMCWDWSRAFDRAIKDLNLTCWTSYGEVKFDSTAGGDNVHWAANFGTAALIGSSIQIKPKACDCWADDGFGNNADYIHVSDEPWPSPADWVIAPPGVPGYWPYNAHMNNYELGPPGHSHTSPSDPNTHGVDRHYLYPPIHSSIGVDVPAGTNVGGTVGVLIAFGLLFCCRRSLQRFGRREENTL